MNSTTGALRVSLLAVELKKKMGQRSCLYGKKFSDPRAAVSGSTTDVDAGIRLSLYETEQLIFTGNAPAEVLLTEVLSHLWVLATSG